MKSIFAILLGLVLPSNGFAQWKVQTSPSDADLRGVSAVSATVAWAGGTKGTVLRTTDGGKSWQTLPVPGAEKLDFRDIEAFGESTVFAMSAGPGEASRIYKTTDGGKTWALQFKNPDPNAFYDAIAFWDERHGLALGDPVDGRYRILTTDDGEHWKLLPEANLPVAMKGEAAFAASGTCLVARGERDVWFVTGGGPTARAFHSTDRGKTWIASELPIGAGAESAGAFSIAFRDDKTAMVVGGDFKKPKETGRTAAMTSDGGKTWKVLENALPYRSAIAWNKDRWIVVGPSGSNFSTDGSTWTDLKGENFNALSFTKSGDGWAVGPKGRIARLVKD